MPEKDKMVDFPAYDPDARVPFPPAPEAEKPSPFGSTPARQAPDTPKRQPYYENCSPDPPAPDPSQTSPGMPDVRDPDTRLPAQDKNLAALSPDVD